MEKPKAGELWRWGDEKRTLTVRLGLCFCLPHVFLSCFSIKLMYYEKEGKTKILSDRG